MNVSLLVMGKAILKNQVDESITGRSKTSTEASFSGANGADSHLMMLKKLIPYKDKETFVKADMKLKKEGSLYKATVSLLIIFYIWKKTVH